MAPSSNTGQCPRVKKQKTKTANTFEIMTHIESAIKIAVLLALASLGTVMLFCEEQDAGIMPFLCHVILDKGIAAMSLLAMALLYGRWRVSDPWLAFYHRWCIRGGRR